MRNVIIVYLKELREVMRDRRTLIFMFLMPTIIVPLLMNLVIGFAIRMEKKARTETLAYAIFGSEFLPRLAEAFENEKEFERVSIPSPNDINSAIAAGEIKFAIVIPESSQQRLEESNQVTVQLYYNNATVASMANSRAARVIRSLGDQLRAERLAKLGLDSPKARDNLLIPITIEERGTANMREVLGERLGGMLPYFFIIFSFIGAMYTAIDAGAGEKERGTLETLLLAPVPRRQIVLGKFLVLFTTGVTSALLCLASIGLILTTKGKVITGAMQEVLQSIGFIDFVLVGAMLIPMAAIFASLLLCISIYARSYREASVYCGPLNMVVIIPAVVAMMPGIELNWITAMVPVMNISLAIKELLKGTMDYLILAGILSSTFIIAGGLLAFTTWWFDREAVLFRE
jgi:sodium transport system permease protein